MTDQSTDHSAAAPGSGRDEQSSRTERLMSDLRRMPLFRQLVPMEAGVGWPIPVRLEAGPGAPDRDRADVYLKLPLFGYRPSPERGQGAVLSPPFATVTLDWATGRPVEYVDLRYSRPWPPDPDPKPVGTFPHQQVRGSVRDYLADRARLLGMYDTLFERLASREGFDQGWTAAFGELLGRLVEPGLEPYYRQLGPKFFERFLGQADGRDG